MSSFIDITCKGTSRSALLGLQCSSRRRRRNNNRSLVFLAIRNKQLNLRRPIVARRLLILGLLELRQAHR